MTEENHQKSVTMAEFVAFVDDRVTIENVRARIRRGSLTAYRNEAGEWMIPQLELERVLVDVEPCHNCAESATSFVIVKYHHHQRVEFSLCDRCAQKAEIAYSRKGGVLEVVTYPLQSEGWLKQKK